MNTNIYFFFSHKWACHFSSNAPDFFFFIAAKLPAIKNDFKTKTDGTVTLRKTKVSRRVRHKKTSCSLRSKQRDTTKGVKREPERVEASAEYK